ncbi:MAG: hypothetical protein ACKOKC_13235 [Chthoniobacterales bacterium]
MKTRADAVREAVELAALADWDPSARRRAFLSLCIAPTLVFLVLVLIYPLFYNVIVSLSDASIYNIRDWRITGQRHHHHEGKTHPHTDQNHRAERGDR